MAEQPLDRVLFGRWGKAPGEEVVVCRVDHEIIEIHCHGGDAAARRILADLERAGCLIVSWQELETACASQFDAECREALSNAPTLRCADILLDQLMGTLRSSIEQIIGLVQRGETKFAPREITTLLDRARFGRHLTEPWQVVIVGRPNVGKSSLLNALAGYQRAIVFDKPGTTRDMVTAEIALDGWPVRLTDTAGIRKAGSALESAGIELALDQARRADRCLIVIDGSAPHADDEGLLAAWPGALVVANKSDLPDAWEERLPVGVHRVSSLTGEGIAALGDALAASLILQVPAARMAVPVAARQVELLQMALSAAHADQWETCAAALEAILQPGNQAVTAPACANAATRE
ncbi:MAG: 50S ribosome-binding GTPase [Planctomycetia bacterium]|nr:50S ribosome-binding GTPase [Planctomycetia bacterium]